jgi:hypothetical protein
VAAERHEVGAGRQRPVRRELRGVDGDRHASLVRGRDDRVERRDPAGDVRGAGDGEQSRRGAGVERPHDRLDGERPIRLALDEPPPRVACPRQQVRVMLDDRGDDDVGRLKAEAVREVVDRLGRVAADDRDVVRPGAAGMLSTAPVPHPVPDLLADLIARRFKVLSEPMRIRLLDRLRDGGAPPTCSPPPRRSASRS